MQTFPNLFIPKANFHQPRYNFLSKSSSPWNKENTFTIQFAKVYISKFNSIHNKITKSPTAYAREIQINSFGITDFIVITNKQTPTIRAFELKLSNWQRALRQASRYKFFANTSTVVLPIEKCKSPLKNIELFKKLHIGLWGFNRKTATIKVFYSPRPQKPKSERYYHIAIKTVLSTFKVPQSL